MIEIAYHLFLLLLAGAIACALHRLRRGPTLADRINAADVGALCFVALTVAHGWRNGEDLWLDIAVVAGLVLFVGTTAVSLVLDRESLGKEEP